eukprot:2197498-Pleurochrysis_carterae.AAC.1
MWRRSHTFESGYIQSLTYQFFCVPLRGAVRTWWRTENFPESSDWKGAGLKPLRTGANASGGSSERQLSKP